MYATAKMLEKEKQPLSNTRYFYINMKLEHKQSVSDLIKLSADMMGFSSTIIADDLFKFKKVEPLEDAKTVIISLQPIEELDRTVEWTQLYRPYQKRYGVFSKLTRKAVTAKAASICHPYIVNGTELPYSQVEAYTGTGAVAATFLVDNAAAEMIKDKNLRFITANGYPVCSNYKKYAAEVLFEAPPKDNVFSYINGPLDLRFRSVVTCDPGTRLIKDRQKKLDKCSLVDPIYWEQMKNFSKLKSLGFRTETGDEEEVDTIIHGSVDASSLY